MRLPVLIGALTLALVGAGNAHADATTDALVFTDPETKTNLTAPARAILNDTTVSPPLYGQTNLWLTESVTFHNGTFPAGTRLSRTQLQELARLHPETMGTKYTSIRPDYATVSPGESRVVSEVTKARRKGRLLPGFKAIGSLAVQGAAFGIGLEIGDGLGGYIYQVLTGETYGGTIDADVEWHLYTSGDPYGSYSPLNTDKYFFQRTAGYAWCDPNNASGCLIPTWFSDMADTMTGTDVQRNTDTCGVSDNTQCRVKWRTEDEMEEAYPAVPVTENTFNTYTDKRTINYTRPVGAPTEADYDAMADVVNNQQETVDSIADMIQPGSAPGTAPDTGTTPGSTTVTGTVNIVPPATTIPSTPAVDFSPISDIDPGCKFPYGFICYAVDFTEQFDVAADAPAFTFDVPTVSVSGNEYGGGGDYTVDLNVMDSYMSLWRGILSVVLWVGAIYLVATRMLGVKFGGDPGEAIDDVL